MNSPTTASEKRRPSFQSHRNLATATDPFVLDQTSYSSLADEASLSNPMNSSNHSEPLFANLNFDTSSLVILDQTPQTQPKVFRKIRGIGGDANEMMANFDMSIKVGQFDRAATLLTRLRSLHSVDSPEFVSMHNRYLKEMISHMIITRQTEMVTPMQKWFEVDMPSIGVKPDAFTYAAMIRMALRMLHGSKRDRTVRRYWELAKNDDLHEDLLAVEVLTDLDLGTLSEVCFAHQNQNLLSCV